MNQPNNYQFRGRFNNNRRPRVYIPINEHIRARVLRVIDQNGENLGELSKDEALQLARDAELDLFVIADKGDIPVAKILDYGKYKFEQSKKEKGQKKNKARADYKEVKMRYNIGIGDYNTKLQHSKKFLEKGLRVKLNITLKGREIQHSNLAKDLAVKFVNDLIDEGTADGASDKMIGRSVIAYIVPGADKAKVKARDEAKRRAEENAKNTSQLQDS